MISEEQAWVPISLGFLSAGALSIEQGTWDGLARVPDHPVLGRQPGRAG
ncbi:MAG TPA: hypothetical protein VKE74_23495 [Gemmataceae bacterium]|nr:hypothetical protein [Gemmataceae bacterium]